MPTYLSPGVYVEEVASGSRPIEGVGTSVAAFVGLAPRGALNAPTLVTNWSQYVAEFGEFTEGYYLAHSVYGFFNNGGTVCYVVRVGGTEGGLAGPGGADGRQGGQRRAPRRGRRRRAPGAHRRRAGQPRRLQGRRRLRRLGPGLGRGRRRPGGRGRQVRRRRRPLPPRGQGRRQGRRDLRRLGQQEGRPLLRHHPGARALEGHHRGGGRLRHAGPPGEPDRAGRRPRPPAAPRPAPSPPDRCPPAPTSATPPTAPASAAWRRSTRSPWSPSRT